MKATRTSEEMFFDLGKKGFDEFLLTIYEGMPEAEAIQELTSQGKKVIELPNDYIPRLQYRSRDIAIWSDLLHNADHIILYHGTSTAFSDAIIRHGLLPRERTGISNFEGGLRSQPDSIYFGMLNHSGNIFDCVRKHAYEAAKRHGGEPLIIRALIELDQCLPDEDVKGAETGIESICLGGTVRMTRSPEHLFLHSEQDPKAYCNNAIRSFTFNTIYLLHHYGAQILKEA